MKINSLMTRRHVSDRSGAGNRHGGAGVPAQENGHGRTCPREAARDCRISRPKPSASSICSSRAGRRSSTSSIYKPQLENYRGQNLPESSPHGTAADGDDGLPVDVCRRRRSIFKFAQHGRSGAWLSELLPHTAKIVGRALLHQVDAHGADQPRSGDHVLSDRLPAGRPAEHRAVGRYGLGSENKDLPAFVVMISSGRQQAAISRLYDRLWGSGFLAVALSGRQVPLRRRSGAVSLEPAGCRRAGAPALARRSGQAEPEAMRKNIGDPEIATRIAQYEMAFRMQSSVPELTDLSKEPEQTFELYGPDARKPGTYRGELPSGPPAGRTRRALRPALPSRLGPAQQPAEADHGSVPATPISRRRR